MTARLIQEDPPKTWLLPGGEVVVGRRATCGVCLECHSVSREHARIEPRENRWYLTDLGGTNGTFLRGVPVSGSVLLHHGDVVRFGQRRLRFESDGERPIPSVDLTTDGLTLMSQPESRQVTLLVADLEGFTAMAAAMPSNDLAAAVRGWCEGCRRILDEQGAVLDKFIGDSVFAWWSGDGPEIRTRALAAARAIVTLPSPPGLPPFACGAALHCGPVSLCRMPDATYTLLGANVNTTFRLESLTRVLRQPLLVTAAFAAGFRPADTPLIDVGSHSLKGIPDPVAVLAAVVDG